MYCPDCNLHYPDHLNFCKRCGKALLRTAAQFVAEGVCCTRCGTRAVEGENFCQQCGARLGVKSEDTTIGACHVCGILWRSAWLYCKHCGAERDRALQLSSVPPPQSAMPTLPTEVYLPETKVVPPPVAETVLMPVRCPSCSADALPLSRFCDICGASLDAVTTNDLASSAPDGTLATEASAEAPALPTLVNTPAPDEPPAPELTVALPVEEHPDLRADLRADLRGTLEARPVEPGHRRSAPEAKRAMPKTRPLAPAGPTVEIKAPKHIVAEIDDVPPMPYAATTKIRGHTPPGGTPIVPRALPRRNEFKVRRTPIVIGGLLVLGLTAGFLLWQWQRRDDGVRPIPTPQPTARAVATAAPASPGPTTNQPPAVPEGMVRVPGGSFEMGRNDADEFERPAHPVTLAPFFIDRTEVTNAQYQRFVRETGRRPPAHWTAGQYPDGEAEFPVVNVSWNDASAYAGWAGKRLPTEEEWEFAARGTDGRLYPWGRDWQPGRANAKDGGAGRVVEVGRYPDGASPYGALDLSGNVWEWTRGSAVNYADPGAILAPGIVIRGGAYDVTPDRATATYRGIVQPEKGYEKTGFRCVRDAR